MAETAIAPILEARSVSKHFGALQALSDVGLSMRPGDAFGIVGPNGAGKSTLLGVLSGAHRPSRGTITLEGRDITALDAAERCRLGIVRTHQVPKPFSGMSVFENVLAGAAFGGRGPASDMHDNAAFALRLCRIAPLANRRAETLGLMDRKRLEIARVMATRPRIVLLDEVGGGLTDMEAEVLVEIIRDIQATGAAVIWIEHIVHVLLKVARHLICMDQGRVIAEGDPEAVMNSRAVREAYLGRGAI